MRTSVIALAFLAAAAVGTSPGSRGRAALNTPRARRRLHGLSCSSCERGPSGAFR